MHGRQGNGLLGVLPALVALSPRLMEQRHEAMAVRQAERMIDRAGHLHRGPHPLDGARRISECPQRPAAVHPAGQPRVQVVAERERASGLCAWGS